MLFKAIDWLIIRWGTSLLFSALFDQIDWVFLNIWSVIVKTFEITYVVHLVFTTDKYAINNSDFDKYPHIPVYANYS